MGNSESKNVNVKVNRYYLTISNSLTDHDEGFMYSNLTDQLSDIEEFLLGNQDSKCSQKIKKEIDTWFETSKKALDELQEEELKKDKKRQVPVTLFDIHLEEGLYENFYPGIDDDDYERAEQITREQMSHDADIIHHYIDNPDPENPYLLKKKYQDCCHISDFFDQSKYSEHESTGLEYFVKFFQNYMTKEFSWQGTDYKPFPRVINLEII